MSRQFIYHVYIADGFADDCDELMHRCSKVPSLNYQTFCAIWKDLKMSCIYEGRSSSAEISELSEEVLQIGKHYMVANTSNFEEMVAGLFLVYALLNLQPYSGFANLRVTPEDVPAITRIEEMARKQQRYDVLYILGSVLSHHTQYHAAARERGMESTIRKYLGGYTSIDRMGVRPKGVFFRQNEELDLIRELNVLGRRYADAKAAVGNGSGNHSRSLSYTNDNLMSELDASLKKIISGIIEDDDDNDDDDDEGNSKDHYTSVKAIKDKAMKNTVNPIKHLTGMEERQQNSAKAKTEAKPNTEVKPSTSKIKTASPTKPVTPRSPRKRKTSVRTPVKKKKAKSMKDDDSDVSDVSIPDMSNGGDDINLEQFHKDPTNTELIETQEIPTNINIEMESAPVVINEQDKTIEIEFIDQSKLENITEIKSMKKYVPKKRSTNPKSLPLALNLMNPDDIEITIIEDDSSKNVSKDGENSRDTSSDVEIIVTDETGKKVDESALTVAKDLKKREQKKTLVKSKFKRMGMLPVANFDTQK